MNAEPQKHMRLSDYARMSGRLGLRRRTAAAVFGLHLGGTLFESGALVMMVPVYQYIQAKGNIAELIADERMWRVLDQAYRIVDVPITLPSLLALSFVFVVMRQILTYLRLIHFSITRERFTRGVRTAGFQRYLQAGSQYHDGASRGAVTNDLTTELERVNAGLTGVMLVLGSFALAMVYASMLVILSWEVTLVSLVIIVAVLIPLRKLHHRTETTGRGVSHANRSMAAFLVERLGSVRLIKLSGMEAAEEINMGRYTGRLQAMMVRMGKLQALGSVIVEPVLLGLVFGLLYVGIMVMNLGLEEIGLIFLVVLRLLPVTKEFMKGYQLAAGSLGSIEAIDSRLNEMAKAKESKGGSIALGALKSGIKFDRVTFHYNEPDRPALTDLSLSIPASGMTALVGPSGSGKSTLIDLLPRLREPQSGTIHFDDMDIRDLDVVSLRREIAYLPQSAQVFNVTAAEHIRYGRPGATMDEIRNAAQLAGADEFISDLPQGYETLLGEGGSRLSGGQRQRLDLARALIRNAQILIMDEPTSNLDANAELAFRDALKRVRRETDLTVIVVAHRLSTVADADQIAVLREGKVIAVGSHGALVKEGGWYAQAFDSQQGSGNGEDPARKVNTQ